MCITYIHHNRLPEAVFLDGGGYLGDGRFIAAWISCIGNHPTDVDQFYFHNLISVPGTFGTLHVSKLSSKIPRFRYWGL